MKVISLLTTVSQQRRPCVLPWLESVSTKATAKVAAKYFQEIDFCVRLNFDHRNKIVCEIFLLTIRDQQSILQYKVWKLRRKSDNSMLRSRNWSSLPKKLFLWNDIVLIWRQSYKISLSKLLSVLNSLMYRTLQQFRSQSWFEWNLQ